MLVQYSPTRSDDDLEDYFVIGHETRRSRAGGRRQYLYTLSLARTGQELTGIKEKYLKYGSRGC